VALTEAQWVSLVPERWADRLHLGVLLEERGRFTDAVAAYRGAAAVGPADDSLALWFLARLLIAMRRPDEAIAEARRAVARDPGNPELLAGQAQALALAGDPTALDVFRAAADRAEAWAREAAPEPLPFRLRPTTSARPTKAELDRVRPLVVARLGPSVTSLRYHVMLGRYLVDRMLWEQAGAVWEMIVAQAPKDAEAHFYRGQVWEHVGAPQRAVGEYAAAVALEARPAFRMALARALWNTDQYYQAMNEWGAVLKDEPQNVEALVHLAQADLRAGDRMAAFRRFQVVLRIAPDHPVARRELAKLSGPAQ
jgi:tetratricopeptide (TPR) repeat protein